MNLKRIWIKEPFTLGGTTITYIGPCNITIHRLTPSSTCTMRFPILVKSVDVNDHLAWEREARYINNFGILLSELSAINFDKIED